MGRKGNGVEVREASIRLSFVFEGAPVKRTLMTDGKPMAPTPANVKYATRLAAEIRERIRHDTFSMSEYFPASGNSGGGLTVAGQLDTWFDTLRMEASTLAGYSSAIRFWKEVSCRRDEVRPLGELPLRGLKLSHILTALATRPALSGKTVNNYVSVLREALQLAVVERVLSDNPATDVPRATWQKEPPDPFSLDEAEAIVADALKHYPEPIGNLIEWRFFSGPRTSEAFGIRWPSVDLRGDHMQIHEAIVRGVEHRDAEQPRQGGAPAPGQAHPHAGRARVA
jgi:integrase